MVSDSLKATALAMNAYIIHDQFWRDVQPRWSQPKTAQTKKPKDRSKVKAARQQNVKRMRK